MTRASRACAPTLAALLCACSALGLGDYERVPCTPHAECEVLSASLPRDACERYYCTASGRGCELRPTDLDGDLHADAEACRHELPASELDCDDDDGERHPGRDEICNGRDDDCDGFIDEGMRMVGAAVGQPVSIDPGVVGIAHAQLGDGTEVLALTRAVGATGGFETSRVVIVDDVPSQPQPLFADDLVCEQTGGLSDERCGFAQLALGADSELVLAAGIHKASCGAGQLRVGVGDLEAFGAALGASPSASNVAFGVDVDPRTGCTRVGSCPGASDPLLAVLPDRDGDPTQALALWRPPAGEGDSCDMAQGAQLMGLGLFVAGSAQSPSLVGSAGGGSVPLGERLATGRPALLALDAGYLITYPAPDRLELLFVPRLLDQDAAPRSDRPIELDALGATAPALAGLPAAGSGEAASDGGPAIADGPVGLALAFRDGQGAEPSFVHFSRLTLDSGDVPHIAPDGSMVKLPAEAEIVDGPVLAYAAKGFVAEDSPGPKGGWLIMWIEQASNGRVLKAARIPDKEQHELPEPYVLERGDDLAQPFVYLKRGASDASGLRYGFVRAGALHLSRMECER